MQGIVCIFIMTHNNLRELKLCLRGIRARTLHPHKIIVVDNASTEPELLDFLTKLSEDKSVDVVMNRFNLWVLGYNIALRRHLDASSPYFVVTDSDIIVPPISSDKCWLSRLIEELEKNPPIGKLGISLDLGYIAGRPEFAQTYRKEVEFYRSPKIGVNYIAPVDTTLAIYRSDYFMFSSPRFFPGHGVLSRPEYYCCRTEHNFRCKHIGWRSYSSSSSLSSAAKKSKFYCFLVVGAYLDPVFLSRLPIAYAFLYRTLRPFFRGLWAINVFLVQLIWFLRSTPFSLNRGQRRGRQNSRIG